MAPLCKDLAGIFRDIPPPLLRRARKIAIERNISLQELLVTALAEYCKPGAAAVKPSAKRCGKTKVKA